MASKFVSAEGQALGTRTDEYRFLPEDLTINPALNGRHVLPNIEELIQDILKNGQHTPVVIRVDGNKPVLCAGFSRYRAVSEINKRKLLPKPIQLRCTYSQCTEEEGFVIAISENRIRKTTTELDDAYNIKRLIKVFGQTEEQVADVYFPGAKGDDLKDALKFVHQRLTLVNLSKEAEKAMIEGRLKGSAARSIARLSQQQQDEVLSKASTTGRIKAPRRKKTASLLTLVKALFINAEADKIADSDAKFWEVDRKRLLTLWNAVNTVKKAETAKAAKAA